MKKGLIILIVASMVLVSCGSYEATGAYTGGQFGNVLGSAIGGLAGGWRGHEVGSIVGTVGGAAAGAAIGHAADKRQQRRYQEQAGMGQPSPHRNLPSTGYAAAPVNYGLTIRDAGIYESHRDGVLTRGETCDVVFEITNTTNQTIYDVNPIVEEVTGNKHIHISPNLRIERIAPSQTVRYTATLKADDRLRNGQIEVCIGVAVGANIIQSEVRQFSIPTAKGRR